MILLIVGLGMQGVAGTIHEGCEGTAYKADLFYRGRVRIAKEQWHVSYVFASTPHPHLPLPA